MPEGPGKADGGVLAAGLGKAQSGVLAAMSHAARRVWLVGLAVVIVIFAGVYAYTYSQPDEYTSTSYISFAPRGERAFSADSIQVLATRYQWFLVAPATLARISAETGVDREVLKDAVTVEIPPATVNMSIAVVHDDARTAAHLANAMAAAVVKEATDDDIMVAEILSPGVVPNHPSGPPRLLLLVGGLVLGVGVGVLVMLAVERFRPRPGVGDTALAWLPEPASVSEGEVRRRPSPSGAG